MIKEGEFLLIFPHEPQTKTPHKVQAAKGPVVLLIDPALWRQKVFFPSVREFFVPVRCVFLLG